VVIVDSEDRIVATGYNGPPREFNHRGETCNMWCERGAGGEVGASCPASHAEQNAFMAADRSRWQGGVLYVTGHVCAECTKLIANSGLARIVVQPDSVDRGYRDPDANYRFIRSMGIGVEVLEPR
jgi:dCMP deaminase